MNPTPVQMVPLILAVCFVAYCLLDLYRAEEVRYLPKWAWAILCLNAFGGIAYLIFGKVR
jgi:hypothetical protein